MAKFQNDKLSNPKRLISLTIRISPKDKANLFELSEQKKVSISQLARDGIKEYINNNK